MVEPTLTIREAIAKAADFFRSKGIDTARLDAELMVGKATGMDRLKLYLNMDRPLDGGERERARELLRRRASREPVAYILGQKEFRSREFLVNPAVLIPRPETELLVDRAEEELERRFPEAKGLYRILEFGIGSGAIAVSLAADLSQARIVATEISEDAAKVARENALKHCVHHAVDVRIQADFAGIEGPFHALVSNPPYVDEADKPTLAPEVRDHEPGQALFAEDSGLRHYHFLAREAHRLLHDNGFLLCEVGAGHAPTVAKIGEQNNLREPQLIRDYAGIERIVLLTKQANSAAGSP